jgi:hypothetical protein
MRSRMLSALEKKHWRDLNESAMKVGHTQTSATIKAKREAQAARRQITLITADLDDITLAQLEEVI